MPFVSMKLCAPESAEITSRIALAVTDLTADVLKKTRELTSVAIEYVAADRWFIGGLSLASQASVRAFTLEVKITEGTNTKDDEAAYVEKVFAAFEAILGHVHPASYIVIHVVRGDAWGYGGLTQEFRYINGKRPK